MRGLSPSGWAPGDFRETKMPRTPQPKLEDYRGYTLIRIRPDTPTESIHIWRDEELISMVPTVDKAHEVIDDWMNAR